MTKERILIGCIIIQAILIVMMSTSIQVQQTQNEIIRAICTGEYKSA